MSDGLVKPAPGPKGRLLQEAWAELDAAAIARSKSAPDDRAAIARLAAAAIDYARHRNLEAAMTTGPRRPMSSDRPIPVGRDKGTQLRHATSDGLRWLHKWQTERLPKTEKKFRADNEALIKAIEHELQFRGEPLEDE